MRSLRCAYYTNWFSRSLCDWVRSLSSQVWCLATFTSVRSRWQEDKKPELYRSSSLYYYYIVMMPLLIYYVVLSCVFPDRYRRSAYKRPNRSLCCCTTFQQSRPHSKPNKPLDQTITMVLYDKPNCLHIWCCRNAHVHLNLHITTKDAKPTMCLLYKLVLKITLRLSSDHCQVRSGV